MSTSDDARAVRDVIHYLPLLQSLSTPTRRRDILRITRVSLIVILSSLNYPLTVLIVIMFA